MHAVHTAAATTMPNNRAVPVKNGKAFPQALAFNSAARAMAAAGVERVAECGPGKVLGGLNRRIDRALESWYLEAPADLCALHAALAA